MTPDPSDADSNTPNTHPGVLHGGSFDGTELVVLDDQRTVVHQGEIYDRTGIVVDVPGKGPHRFYEYRGVEP